MYLSTYSLLYTYLPTSLEPHRVSITYFISHNQSNHQDLYVCATNHACKHFSSSSHHVNKPPMLRVDLEWCINVNGLRVTKSLELVHVSMWSFACRGQWKSSSFVRFWLLNLEAPNSAHLSTLINAIMLAFSNVHDHPYVIVYVNKCRMDTHANVHDHPYVVVYVNKCSMDTQCN